MLDRLFACKDKRIIINDLIPEILKVRVRNSPPNLHPRIVLHNQYNYFDIAFGSFGLLHSNIPGIHDNLGDHIREVPVAVV
jgi:hypothetical protein